MYTALVTWRGSFSGDRGLSAPLRPQTQGHRRSSWRCYISPDHGSHICAMKQLNQGISKGLWVLIDHTGIPPITTAIVIIRSKKRLTYRLCPVSESGLIILQQTHRTLLGSLFYRWGNGRSERLHSFTFTPNKQQTCLKTQIAVISIPRNTRRAVCITQTMTPRVLPASCARSTARVPPHLHTNFTHFTPVLQGA